MKGTQRRMVCEKCGKVFFSWRPEDLPGAQVKCYFCGHTFADDAAKRPPLPAPTPAPTAAPAAPPATATATATVDAPADAAKEPS